MKKVRPDRPVPRWYVGMLHLLPREIREDCGADMVRHFGDLRSEAVRPWQVVRLNVMAVWDVLVQAVAARMGMPGETGVRTKGKGMDSWQQDVRYAFRGMMRMPAATTTVLLTLALGIGGTVGVFSLARQVFLAPLPLADDDRVVRIYEHRPSVGRERNVASYPDYADWRERNGTLSGMAGWTGSEATLSGGDDPILVLGAAVTWDFFEVAGVGLELGAGFVQEDAAPGADGSVILSRGVWRERFGGDPGIMGQRILINGQPATVRGVAARHGFPDGAQFWTPLADNPYEYGRGGHWLNVIGRLAPGVTIDQARTDLQRIALELEAEFPGANEGHSVNVFSLRDEEVGSLSQGLTLLMVAVGFVLLIACANLASVHLARSAARGRELAIRSAVGASRGRLIRQLVTESILLVTLGSVLGVGLALLALRAFDLTSVLGLRWVDAPTLDAGLVGLVFVIGLLTILLTGVFPALQASRGRHAADLRDGGQRGTAGVGTVRMRNGLVTSEVALTVVLLVGAGLVLRSLVALSAVDPGFRPAEAITATVVFPTSRYESPVDRSLGMQAVLSELRAVPGVHDVGLTNAAPLTGRDAGRFFTIVGRPNPESAEDMNARLRVVTPGYFEAVGVPLLQGVDLDDRDALDDSPLVALVNRAFADRHFPAGDAIGSQLRTSFMGTDTFTVVGVVGDVRHQGLDAEHFPEMYLSALQKPPQRLTAVIGVGAEGLPLARSLREAVRRVDPAQPMSDVRPMVEFLRDSLRGPRVLFQVVGALAVFALMLAVVGIYGVVSFNVGRRSKEIGLRMALGAARGDVLSHILRSGGTPVLVGLVFGLLGAFALGSVMRSRLFGIGPADPLTYLAVSMIVATVALAALWLPARNALRIDPVSSLQSE